jgi:hypothetical protein
MCLISQTPEQSLLNSPVVEDDSSVSTCLGVVEAPGKSEKERSLCSFAYGS